MIDLTKVTNFNRSQYELEEFWLVAICVAGKNGTTQALKVHQFLEGVKGNTPMKKIRNLMEEGRLLERLQSVKMGQYRRIEKAFRESIKLDLKRCSIEDLLNIPGVGGKTSRYFLLHSRKNCSLVVLDTHILRYLRDVGGLKTLPKSTPAGKKAYAEIEKMAQKIIQKNFPMDSMAEADLKIWLSQSGRK